MSREIPNSLRSQFPDDIFVERKPNINFLSGHQAIFLIHAGLENIVATYSFLDDGSYSLAIQFQTLYHTPWIDQFDKLARRELPQLLVPDTTNSPITRNANILIGSNMGAMNAKLNPDTTTNMVVEDCFEGEDITRLCYEIPLSDDESENLIAGFTYNDDIGNFFFQFPGKYIGMVDAQVISTIYQEHNVGVGLDIQSSADIANTLQIISDYLKV